MSRARPASARPPPPRPRRALWPWVVAVAVLVVAGGVVAGVVVVKRLDTGRWQPPSVDDFVRIARPGPRSPAASPVIFLERAPIELAPGPDDAPARTSSVVASARRTPVRMPGFRGGDKAWKKLVGCVTKLFAPFAVEVTDQRPRGDEYILVAVGGKPTDLGKLDRRISGLAPFNGEPIPRAVVFGFAGAVGNDVQVLCETVGMEVAHAYGLDHGYLCKDVMTYLPACGAKTFVDKDIRCGEKKARDCHGGKPTQNSYQHLLRVLGPRPPAVAPPPRPAP